MLKDRSAVLPGVTIGGRAEVLHPHDQHDIEPVVLLEPEEYRAFPVGLQVGRGLLLVERHPDPTHRHRVGYVLRQGVNLGDLLRGQSAHDMGGIR
jgi:hypothetical protein